MLFINFIWLTYWMVTIFEKKIESFHTQNMFDPFCYLLNDNLSNKIKMLWDGFMCAAFLL